MRIQNLLKGKLNSFRDLAAVLPSFSMAFAVIAAAGMIAAGCESPAWTGIGDAGTAPAEAAASVPGSAGGREPAADYAADGKHIKVKFKVKNGGFGLWLSKGIVSTQDDNYLVLNEASFANDFTITITAPESDEYLNIRWFCLDPRYMETVLKAKMKPESGTITLDYNGGNKVETKNLYDVMTASALNRAVTITKITPLGEDWEDAKKRAVRQW